MQLQICTAIAALFISFIGILLLVINTEDIRDPAKLMVMTLLLFISEIGYKSDEDDTRLSRQRVFNGFDYRKNLSRGR